MRKIKVPVTIQAMASKTIGEVELEKGTPEEFLEKAQALWESQGHDHPTLNVYNDFDLGEWEILEEKQSDIDFYKTRKIK